MDAGRYNVLLVDGDLEQIDLARSAAVESYPGIELTAVAGGDAVLDWLSASALNKDQLPHIILLDLKLPKLDGLAVLRKLRGFPATSDIPIVVFSAEYTQADVQMSYRAGANSFVARPTDRAGFAEFFRDRLVYWMHPHQRKLNLIARDGAAEQV